MSNELYRDFIDREADDIITSLGGTISVGPPNELYRDFLDRKFMDVINAINGAKIKEYTYTGTGTNTSTIVLPSDWKYILYIEGMGTANNNVSLIFPLINGFTPYICTSYYRPSLGGLVNASYDLTTTSNSITFTAPDAGRALNQLNSEYHILYI